MSDIVERLRMQGMDTDMQDTAREAADEIERLRKENEELRAKSLKIVRVKRQPFVIEDDR